MPHTESMLWIWQVRTGMIVARASAAFISCCLASIVLTPLFGERVGIEASDVSMERVRAGLWLPYAHPAGVRRISRQHRPVPPGREVGYGGLRMSRKTMLRVVEHILLWFFLVLGFVVILLVLAGVVSPPLAFLLSGGSGVDVRQTHQRQTCWSSVAASPASAARWRRRQRVRTSSSCRSCRRGAVTAVRRRAACRHRSATA